MLGLWLNGALWDHFGARMFGVSAVISVVAAVISLWLRADDPQQDQPATEAPAEWAGALRRVFSGSSKNTERNVICGAFSTARVVSIM